MRRKLTRLRCGCMTPAPITGTVSATFPTSCEQGCSVPSKPLYLASSGKLSFSAPEHEEKAERYTEFVSDPAKPVPYSPRPILEKDGTGWRTWLVTDQRFVDGRPDVLTFVSDPLTAPMKLSGEPVVHLIASTSGTDSDWVVKLIDVYPNRELGSIGPQRHLPRSHRGALGHERLRIAHGD